MEFYSTNNRSFRADLRSAVMQGLAPDGGLYMPVSIPQLPKEFFKDLPSYSFTEISLAVAKHLIGSGVDSKELEKIVDHTIQFDAPLVNIGEGVFALELFHGPTLAFKDFGARFLAGLVGYFAREQDQEITILVATSGDTGSAVANGFLGIQGTRVIVLYPSGKVSDIQEKQFTTLGENVTALEVTGTFDDCQRLVKQAFGDEELKARLTMTSANSINIARLIPQMFYYFYAVAQLKPSDAPVVVSVPSGNFGNLSAGLMAKRMGLSIDRFVASTNLNAVVPDFLAGGTFQPKQSIETISNAMDVGNPSNFIRMLDLYDSDRDRLLRDVSGFSFNDEETRNAIRQVHKERGYIMDPHGAVGYLGLKSYLKQTSSTGIFLETAHPGKFKEVVEQTLGHSIVLPDRLESFLSREKSSIKIGKEFDELKGLLMRL